MADKEILTALSDMLEPIPTNIQEMREDIQEIKGDISELKEDVSGLKKDVSGLKKDVAELKEDVSDLKVRVKKIELTQENEILPRLQTIEACYTSTYDRYREQVEEHEEMKQDIAILKEVVTEHSKILQRIS